MLKISVSTKLLNFDYELNIEIKPAFSALFGASGSGKTTTLNLIAGLSKPAKGEIVLGVKTLYSDKQKIHISPQNRNIGYIFQESRLFPHLNVKQNLEFGWRRLPPARRKFELPLIIKMAGVQHLLTRMPTDLSGGEKQRVALARALLASPEYLLMDEPLAALDLPVRLSFLKFLKDIHQQFDLPIIYVSHDLSNVLNFADQVILLQDGKCVGYDSPYQLLNRMTAPPLISREDIPNIFECTVVSQDVAKGLTIVKSNGLQFILPHLKNQVGDKLLLNIPASEIILANAKPEGLSASNIISGKISQIHRLGERILIDVVAGLNFTIEIVPATVERMNLQEGSPIYLIFKASSFRKLDAS
ncbi:MAG: molybdenum ABC transporter ATP-binding protein [bacterium]